MVKSSRPVDISISSIEIGRPSSGRPSALALFATAAVTAAAAAAAAVLLIRRWHDRRLLAASRVCRFRSWPITEVAALEPMLRAMGLRVPAAAIDGTSAQTSRCLSDALCSVGGATGSFVSKDGLILTNHHVALDAVRQASTPERDYLNDGFVAHSRHEELAARNVEVWITRSCVDVSEELREVVNASSDPLARANAMSAKKQSLARSAEAAAAKEGTRCDVQEMWPAKSYMLFTYERLRDVRLVCVPPMSLGCFGGDVENFEWPRHTADFTLLRAYVGPDGTPAPPAPENVPYQPTRWLRASRAGVKEGDFVFLLGFPGTTMRYAPSCRLAYDAEVVVPALVEDFGAKLALIGEHSTDRAAALKLVGAKKGLANNHKRNLGKVEMARKLRLLEARRLEEARLCRQAPDASKHLAKLHALYEALRATSASAAAFEAMSGAAHGSALLAVAHALCEAAAESRKPEEAREVAYRERNVGFLATCLAKRLRSLHPPHEAALIARAARIALRAGVLDRAHADALDAAGNELGRDGGGFFSSTTFLGEESAELLAERVGPKLDALLRPPADETSAPLPPPPTDAFAAAAAAVREAHETHRDQTKALLSERDTTLARLLELQQQLAQQPGAATAHAEPFYPDANGSLRLSAGHVEGYSAADAVWHSPVTTLGGLLEKHDESRGLATAAEREPFECPPRLASLCRADARVRATPNCLCYSTDTVGGNSGSPVLDACGRLVAINFDRQRLGLMNEFAWSIDFSRSIGTDIRYILWLIGEYDGAKGLVEELCNVYS